jgi:hypothetical protein
MKPSDSGAFSLGMLPMAFLTSSPVMSNSSYARLKNWIVQNLPIKGGLPCQLCSNILFFSLNCMNKILFSFCGSMNEILSDVCLLKVLLIYIFL